VTYARPGRTPFYQELPIDTPYDYREIVIEHGAEYARVEVHWENEFRSTADLFVGWNFDTDSPGAIYDLEEEQDTQRGACAETIIIEFDDNGLREIGKIYAGMGFYDGTAVALSYDVKITIFYRAAYAGNAPVGSW
jgi:hypothetical protein